MKKLDRIKEDIMKRPHHDEFGLYDCGCMIYGNIRKLCNEHFVMLNTETE